MSVIKINSLTHDGRGVGVNQEGKKVFVTGALPGEEVRAHVYRAKKSFDEARAEEVKIASPYRVEPPCQYFGVCGGCSLQHANTSLQLQHKRRLLEDQLQHFGQLDITELEWLQPLQADNFGYRHKARLGVRYVLKQQALFLGFREQNGRYLTNIDACSVLHPTVSDSLVALKTCLANLSCYQEIPQVEVAVGEDATAFILRHLQPLTLADSKLLLAFAQQHDVHLYLQPRGPDSIHKIWPMHTEDRLHYTLPSMGLKLAFHPSDFIQINPSINKLMVPLAIKLLELDAGDKVLDLFCGLGNFTLAIAQQASFVTGVEGSEQMVQRAYENSRLNNITNVDFYAANLEAALDATWCEQTYDKILLDPPRAGAEQIVRNIHKFAPQRIVYVSCNPATLARDAGILVREKGYKLIQAGIMDMFPHTGHVESIAVFVKCDPCLPD